MAIRTDKDDSDNDNEYTSELPVTIVITNNPTTKYPVQ